MSIIHISYNIHLINKVDIQHDNSDTMGANSGSGTVFLPGAPE